MEKNKKGSFFNETPCITNHQGQLSFSSLRCR